MSAINSYAVSVKGTDWSSTVNARTAGQAKVSYWRDVTESWPDVPFTAMRVRKIPVDREPSEFVRNREYRGIPWAKIGMLVVVAGKRGHIVGHNSSANLDVMAEETGVVWNCHPWSEIAYYDDEGCLIAAYNIRGVRSAAPDSTLDSKPSPDPAPTRTSTRQHAGKNAGTGDNTAPTDTLSFVGIESRDTSTADANAPGGNELAPKTVVVGGGPDSIPDGKTRRIVRCACGCACSVPADGTPARCHSCGLGVRA